MAAEGAPSLVLLPELAAPGATLAIGGDEGRYLARVVRVRPGERVRATDGRGRVAVLAIEAVAPEVLARVASLDEVRRAATLEVWCGEPEGERADWLVEKLAELGVATLVPLVCARGDWARAGAKRERWERLAVAALRQSLGAHRMEIRDPERLEPALARLGATTARRVCLPDGAAGADPGFGAPGHCVAAVGPSSGFEAAELKRLEDNGFAPMALAASRLRTETAAVAAAARWAAAALGPGAAIGGTGAP